MEVNFEPKHQTTHISSPPSMFWKALQAEFSILQYPVMTGKPHGGLQCWLKLLPVWSSDQSSEAEVLLASDQWNTAHWRRTWCVLVGGSLLISSSHFSYLFKWCWATLMCIHLFLIDELKEKLQDFVSDTNSQRPGFIKMVRHTKQEGLIRSRVSGWRVATAPVVALFDAHVEFSVGWWVTHKCSMRWAQLSSTKAPVLESYRSVRVFCFT